MSLLTQDVLAGVVSVATLVDADPDLTIERRLEAYPAVHCKVAGVTTRGLFAAKQASPGDLLVTETSAVWQRGDESGKVFIAHDDPRKADAVAMQMAPHCLSKASAAAAALPEGLTRRQLLHAAMQANCFELEARQASGDAALFPVICLSNHSCLPNAAVQQVQREDGGQLPEDQAPTYTLSARLPIANDEEILISYLPRSWPKRRRQAACKKLWKFECRCIRCVSDVDDTIVIRTSCCESGRACFPDPPRTTAVCLECGSSTDISGTVAAGADAEETLGDVSIRGDADAAELSTVAQGLLNHAVLAPDDARVFAVLNGLAGHVAGRLQEAADAGQEDEAAALQGLFEGLMGQVATVALRSRFVTPQDLGLEVEVE